jgi:SAM-dependent methyltransferase
MNTLTSSVLRNIHSHLIYNRRIRQLHHHVTELISPTTHSVLDVGCGDGLLTSLLSHSLPHMYFQGIDVLERPKPHINIKLFDGYTIPYRNKSFDTVLFVDVLHHTTHPDRLLREAARVARKHIIIKDHISEGSIDTRVLSFMDWVGNACHRVALPYNYKSMLQWQQLATQQNLHPITIRNDLALYPMPFNYLFDQHLHFLGKFRVGA